MKCNYFTLKSRGLGQAEPVPSRECRLWLGLRFKKAGACSSQAEAAAFRPSRCGMKCNYFTLKSRGLGQAEPEPSR